MKVIIDIPETEFNHIKKVWSKRRGSVPYTNIAFGTPITDDITNGDMFKYLFGWIKYEADYEKETVLVYIRNSAPIQFDLDWWNAPYKEAKDE